MIGWVSINPSWGRKIMKTNKTHLKGNSLKWWPFLKVHLPLINICAFISICTHPLMSVVGKNGFNELNLHSSMSRKSRVNPSEDHASTTPAQPTTSLWGSCHESALLAWLLVEPTEMLCFSLSVLTTVAAGDWSTFLESLILPSVGSRPKYLTCQKGPESMIQEC